MGGDWPAGTDKAGPTVAALSEAVLRRLAWLDLSAAQLRFASSTHASLEAIWNLSVEYRRFLLLRLAHPELDVPAPPLIDSFWRLHAADREKFASDCAELTIDIELSPDWLAPTPRHLRLAPGPEVREVYETTFPSGEMELWGWPAFEPDHRFSAPAFGPVHTRLPSAIDESTRIRLREEALEGRQYLAERCASGIGAGESGARSPLIDWCAIRSPILHNLHWNAAIPRLIAEQTGAIVSPRGPGYIHYRSGDSVGIHRDYGYDLVLLTLLSGAIEPLHCHLHLADTPAEEIEDLAKATNRQPAGGTPFEINSVPFLLSGHRIPHHRAPQERASDTVVLA